jgi:hypothetical protein
MADANERADAPLVELHLKRFSLPQLASALKRRRVAAVIGSRTLFFVCLLTACASPPVYAEDKIENQVAVFSALDKVTARISKFEVELNKTVEFGALRVTPRACYSRPPTEEPKTTTFVEVDETQLDGSEKRIFTGWMFAESPGIYGLEHPTYDVWLTACEKPIRSTAEQAPAPGQPAASGDAAAPSTATDDGSAQQPEMRRRVRR